MEITENPTELPAWDYTIRSFDGWTLEIAAGVDSSLHTSPAFVLRFTGVTYIDCPTGFRHASIRLADKRERQALSKREAVDGDQQVYALDAETMGAPGPQSFLIVAEGVEMQRS